MSNINEKDLSEFLESNLRSLNDIDDAVATSSAECNYEDYEEFTNSVDLTFFRARSEWSSERAKETCRKRCNLGKEMRYSEYF